MEILGTFATEWCCGAVLDSALSVQLEGHFVANLHTRRVPIYRAVNIQTEDYL